MINKKIQLQGILKRTVLCRINDMTKKSNVVFIEPITKKQEDTIDNSKKIYNEIRFVREDKLIIPAKCIYLYGEVDFNKEEDLNFIKRFNLINEDGAYIHSNFDYETGTADFKRHYTWNALSWFIYCHCVIGKPKRIIVYKVPNIKIYV